MFVAGDAGLHLALLWLGMLKTLRRHKAEDRMISLDFLIDYFFIVNKLVGMLSRCFCHLIKL